MRKLIASTFTSLDGVMQAPGGPTEDPTGNFTLGGWLFAFGDPGMDLSAAGFDGKDRELVLGRKTYEIFEAYWFTNQRMIRLRGRSMRQKSMWRPAL
jgi:dihydrofolate reductase